MKTNYSLLTTAIFLISLLLFSSCSSSTLITSAPTGAKLYMNGEAVGNTPYTHTDSEIVGSCNTVRIEKEGYETLNTSFCKDEEPHVGAIIGGIFLLVPFAWAMKYKATHHYELDTGADDVAKPASAKPEVEPMNTSKADRLRELKKLLDEGILTQEEYEKEKKKVLDGK